MGDFADRRKHRIMILTKAHKNLADPGTHVQAHTGAYDGCSIRAAPALLRWVPGNDGGKEKKKVPDCRCKRMKSY